MSDADRVRIPSNRIKNLWGSRLVMWQENRHIIKTQLMIFAPAPFNGFCRRAHTPWGWSKRYNYISKNRRTWYRVYEFFRLN